MQKSKVIIIFLLLFTFCLAYAGEVIYNYSINYWFLGKIGNAAVVIENNDSHYTMRGYAKPTGLAAIVSSNHQEQHTSQGTINEGGLFVPHTYRMLKIKDDYIRDINFTFNHNKREIYVSFYEEENISKSHFDFKTMRFETLEKPTIRRKKGTLTFYATNDLLSMFYNIRYIKPTLKEKEPYPVNVVGSENRSGELNITLLPDTKEIKETFVSYTTLPTTLSLTLSQAIFEDNQGQLYVAIDEDNISKEFVMKDVMLFGDVRVFLEK